MKSLLIAILLASPLFGANDVIAPVTHNEYELIKWGLREVRERIKNDPQLKDDYYIDSQLMNLQNKIQRLDNIQIRQEYK